MAVVKCHRNGVGSAVLDRAGGGGNSRRLWPLFRRKIIDTMRCGGSRHRNDVEERKPEVEQRSECRSERLSDLLRLSMSETCSEKEEEEEEVKKKVEALEDLKRVVKRLQCDDDVLGGAKEVRKLTKEDSKARTTLSLLGAIPPLVGMLDSDDVDFQIASLYALLNLGIGNDA